MKIQRLAEFIYSNAVMLSRSKVRAFEDKDKDKDLWFEDKGKDKDLWFEDKGKHKDKDLWFEDKDKDKDLWFEAKDKDLQIGSQGSQGQFLEDNKTVSIPNDTIVFPVETVMI